MPCCHSDATERQFDRRRSEQDLQRYQQHGPDRPTRILLDALTSYQGSGTTLLDVGSGVGVIAHELLGRGVRSAILVEAASAPLAVAQAEAAARGYTDLMRFVQADFVDVADTVPAADVVTLDRVVCCYPDYDALLSAATRRCRRVCALSHPRDHWYLRAWVALQNALRRLVGNPFRTFVHPEPAMEARLRAEGFGPVFDGGNVVWRVAVYQRQAPSPLGS